MNILPKDTIKVSTTGEIWANPSIKTVSSAKYAMLKNGRFMRKRRACDCQNGWQVVTEAHIKKHGVDR